MPLSSDGVGDTIRLLWRHEISTPPARQRGPRQRFTVDQIIDTAIDLADESGLDAVSMRSVAAGLGIGAMSLYTYVASREQLLLAMADQALGRTELTPWGRAGVADRMQRLARTTYGEHRRQPWLAEAAGVRPGLGPHAVTRFEWQLRALDGLGLDDLELDQTVTLLTGFAIRAAHVARAHAGGPADLAWWDAAGPVLNAIAEPDRFPLADRVGNATGAAYRASRDPDLEFDFGLARIVDGLLAHIRATRRAVQAR